MALRNAASGISKRWDRGRLQYVGRRRDPQITLATTEPKRDCFFLHDRSATSASARYHRRVANAYDGVVVPRWRSCGKLYKLADAYDNLSDAACRTETARGKLIAALDLVSAPNLSSRVLPQ